MQIPVPIFICPSAILPNLRPPVTSTGAGGTLADRSDWGKSRFHHGRWLRLPTYRGVMGAQPVSDPASNSSDTDWMQNGVLYPNSATKFRTSPMARRIRC